MKSNRTLADGFNTLASNKDKIFSFYKNAKANQKESDISLPDYLAMLSDYKRKSSFDKLRALPVEKYKKAKLDLPCITGSCLMEGKGRSKPNIQSLNGFAVVDIDDLPCNYSNWDDLKQILTKDPYTYLIHYSASGRGLCLFVKIEILNDFKEIYLALEKDYQMIYGVNIDFLADETRLRFISYDPEYFLNESPKIYTKTLKGETAAVVKTPAIAKTPAIPKKDKFVALSSSPATAFNNSGFDGLEFVNKLLEDEGYKITKGRGKTIFEYQRAGGAEKSIVAMFNQSVVKFHVFSSNTGLLKNEYNLFGLFKELQGFDDYEAQKQLSAIGFGRFIESETKVIKGQKESYTALLEFLKDKDIKLNCLTGIVEINCLPLTDFDISEMLYESSLLYNKNTSKNILLSVIDVIAISRQYHPFMDFLKKLETIEKTNFNTSDELDSFIDCFTSSTEKELMRIYFKRWLLGLFDLHLNKSMTKNVLVVSGAQNACKTSLSKNILPIELQDYGKVIAFDVKKLTDTKVALCSILVGCFDEFENILTKNNSLADFKNLTASHDIYERRAFRRNHEQMYRGSIIMATTNHKDILTDSTGNTRFLMLDVQKFDLEKYFKIDLNKLWRVIYDYYLKGERSNLTEPERALQSKENTEFEVVDPYCEMIEKDFKFDEDGFLTSTEVMQLLEGKTRQYLNVIRIGQALKKLGYEKFAKKINGNVRRGYRLQHVFESD